MDKSHRVPGACQSQFSMKYLMHYSPKNDFLINPVLPASPVYTVHLDAQQIYELGIG